MISRREAIAGAASLMTGSASGQESAVAQSARPDRPIVRGPTDILKSVGEHSIAEAWGIDFSGQEFSDAAWARMIDHAFSVRTSPTGRRNFGMNEIALPKGKIKLRETKSFSSAVIGMLISGAGKYATSIEFHNDEDPLFDLGGNIALSFRDISIVHVPQNDDRSVWTNSIVRRTGINGGNELLFERVHTHNWNIIDENIGLNLNNDTTRMVFCRFQEPRCLTYSRNKQSVINVFDQCTVTGRVERMMDIAGNGYTKFDTCNIVISGVWLFLADIRGHVHGRSSTYTFLNTKGEPFNPDGHPNGATSKLVEVENASEHVLADVSFINSGFSSSGTIDPTVPTFDLTSGVRLRWDGGALGAGCSIRTTGVSSDGANQRPGIVFENLRDCFSPKSIARSGASRGHPSITFRNVRGINDITVSGGYQATPYILEAEQRNMLTEPPSGCLAASPLIEFWLDFYGSLQRIKEIVVFLHNKEEGDVTISVYSDRAKTTLIDVLILSEADNSSSPVTRRMSSVADKVFSDGLCFTCYTPNGPHFGHISVIHEAV